jgi:hypothetical protein
VTIKAFGSRLGLLVAATWLVGAGTASAGVALQKKAKEAGLPAENCLYCHGEKLPKKGAATYNDRGKFLMAEKDKRKASEADVAWLKDYVEKK